MTGRIPNFRGRHALVLHPKDRNREALVEQLERLGTRVTVRWPAEKVSREDHDIIFFDADLGYDGLFGWPADKAPVPLVAILGSEAPGRLEWMLSHHPAAYLMKPIGSTGVFSALSIAFHAFAVRHRREERLHHLEERLRMRGIVLRAAIIVMESLGIDDVAALKILRSESMRQNVTLEHLSVLVVEEGWVPRGTGTAPEVVPPVARNVQRG